MTWRTVALALALTLGAGCGSDSGSGPPPVDISGAWNGTWSSDGGKTGSLYVLFTGRMTSNGPRYDTYAQLGGADCTGPDDMGWRDEVGMVVGDQTMFSVDIPSSMGTEVNFRGAVAGSMMTGTYRVTVGPSGDCSTCNCPIGASGTFEMTR